MQLDAQDRHALQARNDAPSRHCEEAQPTGGNLGLGYPATQQPPPFSSTSQIPKLSVTVEVAARLTTLLSPAPYPRAPLQLVGVGKVEQVSLYPESVLMPTNTV